MLFFISSLLLSRRGLGDIYDGFAIHLTKKKASLWVHVAYALETTTQRFSASWGGFLKTLYFDKGPPRPGCGWCAICGWCASGKTHRACSSLQAQFASVLEKSWLNFEFAPHSVRPVNLSTGSCSMSGRLQQKKTWSKIILGDGHGTKMKKNDSETQEVVKF